MVHPKSFAHTVYSERENEVHCEDADSDCHSHIATIYSIFTKRFFFLAF